MHRTRKERKPEKYVTHKTRVSCPHLLRTHRRNPISYRSSQRVLLLLLLRGGEGKGRRRITLRSSAASASNAERRRRRRRGWRGRRKPHHSRSRPATNPPRGHRLRCVRHRIKRRVWRWRGDGRTHPLLDLWLCVPRRRSRRRYYCRLQVRRGQQQGTANRSRGRPRRRARRGDVGLLR